MASSGRLSRGRLTGGASGVAGRVILSLILILLAHDRSGAAPDFSASEILVSPSAPLEAEVVTFTAVLRNTGPDDAGSVYVSAEWPLMGFLVDSSGFDDAEVDHEARTTATTVPLAAGAEHRFVLRVLAPRGSGGDALTVAVHAAHFASGTEYWDTNTVTIETRVGEGGIVLGGLGVTRAGIVVLAFVGGGMLLWLLVRWLTPATVGDARRASTSRARMVGPGAAVAAVMLSLGFWTLFGVMAWRDYASLTRWRETTCTVLGGRLSAQPTTRTRRVAAGQSTDETNDVPVLGLKYAADGREMLSSGYDTGSRLGIGGRGGRREELAQWTVGGVTSCWYDPADPTDVVVLRGFGGAYIFALFPVPLFLIGATRIRSLIAGR